MTVAEKIGQMALIEKNSVSDLNDIAKYGLGAMMSGGGGKPENNTPEGWFQMVENSKAIAKKLVLAYLCYTELMPIMGIAMFLGRQFSRILSVWEQAEIQTWSEMWQKQPPKKWRRPGLIGVFS